MRSLSVCFARTAAKPTSRCCALFRRRRDQLQKKPCAPANRIVPTSLSADAPNGHWKTTTFLAGLTCEGLIAPFVLDGPINAECFLAYVEQILVPVLRQGDTVILDNLSSHKNEEAARLIAGAGARLLFLPPYSPDLNPIEMAFAKLKELLRQAQARTVDALWDLIGRTLNLFTPEECANYVRHCGYNPL